MSKYYVILHIPSGRTWPKDLCWAGNSKNEGQDNLEELYFKCKGFILFQEDAKSNFAFSESRYPPAFRTNFSEFEIMEIEGP